MPCEDVIGCTGRNPVDPSTGVWRRDTAGGGVRLGRGASGPTPVRGRPCGAGHADTQSAGVGAEGV